MPAELRSSREGATLVLTIADPATRNALSLQVYAAGIEALATAEADDGVRAVVLRGDGESFCAGGDLHRIGSVRQAPDGRAVQAASTAQFHEFVLALRAFPKPTIAAVEGWAAGGGASLALACDLVVAARDARFVLSYGKVGFTPDGGGLWQLAHALPRALVLELAWLAGPIDGARLHAHGVVNRVTDRGGALAEALALAERLAAMAPNAIAGVKELVDGAPLRTLPEHLEAERAQFVANVFHDNGGEGVRAFFEKRAPRFE